MALKVYTSGNYIITDTGTVMHEFAKGYTTYSYNQSTQTFTIRESVGGSFTVTRAQLLADDITDEAESAYTFNSFVTFLRENTGFKTAPGGSGASYKVYTALLNQSGTDAPVATVLENTLGLNAVFTYDVAGQYTLTDSAGLFLSNKTAVFMQFKNGGPTMEIWVENVNQIIIGTDGQDEVLLNTFIEIRVYD